MQVGIDVDYRKSSYLDFVIRILVIELSDDGGVVWRVIFTEITHICSHFYLEYFFGETEFHVQVAVSDNSGKVECLAHLIFDRLLHRRDEKFLLLIFVATLQ